MNVRRLLLVCVPGDAVLVTGKEVWSHTMTVVTPPVSRDNPNATKDGTIS